jgi:hypothetical protein
VALALRAEEDRALALIALVTPLFRGAILQVMQFDSVVLAPLTHALTVVPVPVPSHTCLLEAFTHALTVVPVLVPSPTCLLAPFLPLCCHLES